MNNSITCWGNLGKDPEVTFSDSGLAICKFSVAVSQGKDKKPMWLQVVTFGDKAKRYGEWFHQGQKVIVSGTLKQDVWNDKKTGEVKKSFSVRANEVSSAGGAKKSEDDSGGPF